MVMQNLQEWCRQAEADRDRSVLEEFSRNIRAYTLQPHASIWVSVITVNRLCRPCFPLTQNCIHVKACHSLIETTTLSQGRWKGQSGGVIRRRSSYMNPLIKKRALLAGFVYLILASL